MTRLESHNEIEQNEKSASYLICATPRTGSTLLCAMLESTGVAGRPQSYFRRQDADKWSLEWGIEPSPNGKPAFSDYVRAAVNAGLSDNGVFGARIMWGTMEEVTSNIERTYPEVAKTQDRSILAHVFGDVQFIYLKRKDVIAQAVSRTRAEQTDLWHSFKGMEVDLPTQEPQYDFEQINRFVQEAEQHNVAWKEWFRLMHVEPLFVYYEELDKDPMGVTLQILKFLKLELPKDRQIRSNTTRLADNLNQDWIMRYCTQIGIHR